MKVEEYEHIANKYMNAIYKIALNACKNKADAEDVVQNTFIKLWNQSRKFENEEHIRKWLIRVTINECNSLLRTPWKKRTVSIHEIEEISAGIANGDLLENGVITISDKEDSIIFETITSEKIDYKITEKTLPSGLQVPIITSSANTNQVKTAESYFSVGEVVYSINVASQKGNAEKTLLTIMSR